MSDKRGDTRRKRYERFGKQSPSPSFEGFRAYIVEDFSILSSIRKWRDGVPEAIQFAELIAFAQLHNRTFYQSEVSAIIAMDDAFRAAVSQEAQDIYDQDK